MKHLVVLIGLFVMISACKDSNEAVVVGNKTTMEVEPMFDAGKVLKGEVITAKFTVKNTGKHPLVIGEVKGSCSCTVAEYPKDPISPGDAIDILAYVDTKKTGLGLINKSVRIVANTDPSITKVVVRADVARK
jgi:Protein of unknown function (DUF1573)